MIIRKLNIYFEAVTPPLSTTSLVLRISKSLFSVKVLLIFLGLCLYLSLNKTFLFWDFDRNFDNPISVQSIPHGDHTFCKNNQYTFLCSFLLGLPTLVVVSVGMRLPHTSDITFILNLLSFKNLRLVFLLFYHSFPQEGILRKIIEIQIRPNFII